ncbi:MAG: hypothetical protein M1816_005868 [Peltula sp. TS41687]|nr:MAG: hypothetical protein M1816_005868 [Peltula sp. TS41687]
MSTYQGKLEHTTGRKRSGAGLDQVNTAQLKNGVACVTERHEDASLSETTTDLTPCRMPMTEHRMLSQDGDGVLPYAHTDFAPPVTVHILQELELRRIIANFKLRHDINFDPHLHFRPNTDGTRGQRKRREADAYWDALHKEFKLCPVFGQRPGWEPERAIPRIYKMLCEVREILRTLVPDRDMQIIDETLDITLLMQQIRRSSLDYTRMAIWLSGILKSHCAPLRDALVDEMVLQLRNANQVDDHWPLVDGIRMLFGILEAMKLDIANHQVRNLRTLLIEDTVSFEQHLFLQRVNNGRLDVNSARRWYAQVQQDWMDQQESAETCYVDGNPVEVLVRGLTEAISSSQSIDLPETFAFDYDRLDNLRVDLQDMITLEICVKVFELSAYEEFNHRGRIPDDTIREMRLAILSLVNDASGRIAWLEHSAELALEMVRLAHKLKCDSSCPDERTIERIEDRLIRYWTVESRIWQHYEDRAMRFIGQKALKQTLKFLSQPLLNVAESAGEQAPDAATSTFETLLADLARRLAHIASLHWRVFGPIVYSLTDEEQVDETESRDDFEPATTISSLSTRSEVSLSAAVDS